MQVLFQVPQLLAVAQRVRPRETEFRVGCELTCNVLLSEPEGQVRLAVVAIKVW